jgi:hypothetical protein
MLPIKVGLVDMTGEITAQELTAAAAALNIQVTRDLPQYWPVSATVSYLPNPHQIPPGTWPVQLVKSLPPGEGGYHMTKNKQPYAKVIAAKGSEEWTVDASHEIIEMLVDPYGSRMQSSTSIEIVDGKVQDGDSKFDYLVEACDPCEADPYTYTIDGISVSDFITPHFYDLVAADGVHYSFTGAIKTPRQLLPGGYISFVDPATNEMNQILWVDPSQPPQLRNLGAPNADSLRLFVEAHTHELVRTTRPGPSAEVVAARRAYRAHLATAAQVHAGVYV